MANWELANPIAMAKQRRDRAPWYLDLSPVTLSFSIIGLVMLTSMLYLTQASRVAAIGYDIRSLETTRARLQREREQLQLEAAQLQSLARVEEQAGSRLRLERALDEQFVPAAPPPVDVEAAVRRAEEAAAEQSKSWPARLALAIRGAPGALAGAARGQGPRSTLERLHVQAHNPANVQTPIAGDR